MTANTTGEKYREEYDAYFNSIEDKNAVKTYEGWLESALAQSQKEAGDQALKLQAYQRAVEKTRMEFKEAMAVFHNNLQDELEAIQ